MTKPEYFQPYPKPEYVTQVLDNQALRKPRYTAWVMLASILAGLMLADISEGYPSFTFPSYILAPGESIRVYTNEYHPEWGGFSFEYSRAIWNNTEPDVGVLYDNQGQEVSRKSY